MSLTARLGSIVVMICFLLLGPALGLVLCAGIEARHEALLAQAAATETSRLAAEVRESGLTLAEVCARRTAAARGLCAAHESNLTLRGAAIAALGFGAILLLVVLIVPRWVGADRDRLARTFEPVARFAVLGLSASVIAQGAILVFGIWSHGQADSGRLHLQPLLGIGFAAIACAAVLIKACRSFLEDRPTGVLGEPADAETAPGLTLLVRSLAETLGAPPPDTIVLGNQPEFYITAASVRPVSEERPLTGVTLYLSVPFLELLTPDELKAIIGHELGHFRSRDIAYSRRFQPAYVRLGAALDGLAEQNGSALLGYAMIFAWPVRRILAFVLNEFGLIERRLRRDRELEADQAGASVAGPRAAATALLKVSLYADLWDEVRALNIEALDQGRYFADLPALFCHGSAKRFEAVEFAEVMRHLGSFRMAHPTDTHPTLTERLAALGIGIGDLDKEDLRPAGTPLSCYLADPAAFAEALSLQEHKVMIALGHAAPPDPTPDPAPEPAAEPTAEPTAEPAAAEASRTGA